MKKIILFPVTVFRKLRSAIATCILKYYAKSCGSHVGAARIPHVGSKVQLEIGSHCGFNGFTATGWGGG